MTLFTRAWRSFAQNKGRWLSLLVLLVMGSYFLVTFSGIGQNLGAMVDTYAQANFQEDLAFATDTPINPSALETLAAQANASMEACQSVDLSVGESGSLRLLTPGSQVNRPAVTSGRGLQQPGEVLLDPVFAAAQHLSLGDSLPLGSGSYVFVGTVCLPQYVYITKNVFDVMPSPGFGIGVISAQDMAAFPGAATLYAVRFATRQNLNAQASGLHQTLAAQGNAPSEWVDAKSNKRIQMPWASITGMKTMSLPMPVLMFLLCCLILGVLLWRTVKADSPVIGALYAQGVGRKALMLQYLALPLALALIGSLLGTAMAAASLPVAVSALTTYYSMPLGPIAPQPLMVALALVLPLLFVALSGWLVLRKELAKPAAQLMRGDEESSRVSPLESRLRLSRLSFPTRFALRSQLRSIPRLLFLLFGVTMASMVMLLGFTLNHSMNTVFSAKGMRMYDFAYEYSFKQVRQSPPPEGATPFNALKCYPQGQEAMEFYVMGAPEDCANILLADERGKPIPLTQTVLTAPLASRLGLRPGDSFAFVNKLDGQVFTLTVDAVAQTYAGQFLFMPLPAFNTMAGQPQGSHSGLLTDRAFSFPEAELSGVKDLQDLDGAMDELALPMVGVVVFMALISGAMALVVIFLVTSLLIQERRSTISLLKVFGYTDKEVDRLVLHSSTWVVILGYLLAIPLMLLMANAMYGYLGQMINLVLPILIDPLSIPLCLALVLGVYLLTLQLCKKKIRQIPLQQVVQSDRG